MGLYKIKSHSVESPLADTTNHDISSLNIAIDKAV